MTHPHPRALEAAARALIAARHADDDMPSDDVPTTDYDRDLARAAVSAYLAEAGDGWRDIETAPKDGRLALVYRPLARNSSDEPVAVKRLMETDNNCWDSTVPAGAKPCNPTDGMCHVTHWMPLPAPTSSTGEEVMGDPVILFVRPKEIKAGDKKMLRDAGVMVVEVSDPRAVKLTRAHAEITGTDFLKVALTTILNDPTVGKNVQADFARRLCKAMIEPPQHDDTAAQEPRP